jgi:predicted metal-dependent HD superfamily phosphohydrolase
VITELKHRWTQLCNNKDSQLTSQLWNEIETQYSEKSRHYHTLNHLHHMFQAYDEVEPLIHHKAAFQFAIWYHDIIYKASKNNNEEQSARVAVDRLQKLSLENSQIELIKTLIISTKKHSILADKHISDNAYLLDIDLSILGSHWDSYQRYCSNIRKEYKIYPTFMYNKGRKQVLKHFLDRNSLYFTEYFKGKFETQARKNIKRELELL